MTNTFKPASSAAALMIMRDLRLRVLAKNSQEFGPFDMVLQRGDQVAILGPSGAGKSTLLKAMARDSRVAVACGAIVFQGLALDALSPQDLASRRAVLPQSHSVAFGLSVELIVSLGRVAQGGDLKLTNIVREALSMAKASHLLHRRFDTLSGGEQAKVQIARVFAQLWDQREGLMLLDEPFAALDPGLQFELMGAIRSFALARRHALVAVVHDINQALGGSFDRLWLIRDGQLFADVPVGLEAIATLAELYGIDLQAVPCTDDRLAVVATRRLASSSMAFDHEVQRNWREHAPTMNDGEVA